MVLLKQRLFLRIIQRLPLRFIVVVPFVIQIFLAVAVTGWLSLRNGHNAIDDLASQLQYEITDRIEDQILDYLEAPVIINQINGNAVIAEELNLQNFSQLFQHFSQQLQIFPDIDYIYVASPDGKFVSVTSRNQQGTIGKLFNQSTQGFFNLYQLNKEGKTAQLLQVSPKKYDPKRQLWYQSATQTQTGVWTPIYTLQDMNSLGITNSYPVYDQQGKLKAVFGSDVLLSDISQFLSRLKIGKTGQSFIIEPSGLLVATSTENSPDSSSQTREMKRISVLESENLITQATAQYLKSYFGDFKNIKNTQKLTFNIEGRPHYLQVAPLTDNWGINWLVVVTIPEADFMEKIHENTRNTILLCLGALGIATGLGVLTSRWITKPILELRNASLAIATGNLNQTLEAQSIKEFNTLALAFNQMSYQLQQSHLQLEEKVEERTRALEQEIQEKTIVQETLREQNAIINRQNLVLAELAADTTFRSGNLSASVQKLTEAMGQVLGRERSSIWLYDQQRIHLCCVDLFTLSTGQHSTETDLDVADYPHYFLALEKETVIPADDACTDYRTCEFRENYFQPLGITSVLEIPLQRNGQIIGVLCAEHIGEFKPWTIEEQGFARSIGNLVSLAIESYHRHLAEEKLRQSEANLAAAQRIAHIGNWSYEIDSEKLIWSEEVFRIFGFDSHSSEPSFTQLKEMIYSDDLELWLAKVEAASRGQNCFELDHRILRTDGSVRYIESRSQPIVNQQGEVTGLFGTIIDITERKLTEKALIHAEERWQLAVRNDGIWDWDIQTNDVFYSKRWKEMLGYTEAEILNEIETLFNLIHPQDQSILQKTIDDYLSGSTSEYITEFRMRCKDGSYKWVLSRGQAVRDRTGKPIRLVGSHVDVSDVYNELRLRKQREEALQLILQGTATATGSQFFQCLVKSLAQVLKVRYCFVAECLDGNSIKARTLGFWNGDTFGENFEYNLAGTPCAEIIKHET